MLSYREERFSGTLKQRPPGPMVVQRGDGHPSFLLSDHDSMKVLSNSLNAMSTLDAESRVQPLLLLLYS